MTLTILTVILTVAFVGGILLLLPRMARPTVPFGVRIPHERAESPVVRQATHQYYRGVVLTMVVVGGAAVALARLVAPEVVLGIVPFVALAAWFVPYLGARRTVLAAKRTDRWFDGARQAAVADTTLRTAPPPYPWLWAAPAIMITLATLAAGAAVYPSLPDRIATHVGFDGPDRFTDTTIWSAFGLPAVQVLLTVMLLGLAAVALRSKADLSAAAPEASAFQYREYAITMARLVLLLAAGANLTMLMSALMVWDVLPATTVWLVISMVPALVTTVVLIVVAVRRAVGTPAAHRSRSRPAATRHHRPGR